MKNSTLKVLAGVIAASMSAMALYSVVSADDAIFGDNGIMTLGATGPSVGMTGDDNTGDDNTGDDTTGDDNTGDDNTGDDNTGDDNTGDDNTGDDNTGDDNTGDDNTGDDNTGDDNIGDDTTGDDNTGDDNTGDDNTGDDTTGDDNTGGNGGNGNVTVPEAPAGPVAPVGGRPGVAGPGGSSAEVGAASAQPVSSAQAAAVISSVKAGESVSITMGKDTVIPARTIAAFANKKNASLTLNYSGVGITINSDDVDSDVVKSFSFKTSTRFLSTAEKKAFAGAKEVRQLSLKGANLNGIDKVTVTFKMRGGSKNMDAKLLLRTANGKYTLVDEAKVGSDRNVSFEITDAGNYIVYTGEADIEYTE